MAEAPGLCIAAARVEVLLCIAGGEVLIETARRTARAMAHLCIAADSEAPCENLAAA